MGGMMGNMGNANHAPAPGSLAAMQMQMGMCGMGGSMMGGVQMGGDAKKQRTNKLAGEDETKMLISNKAAGAIIGKGAQTLKNLRESYGCRVEVLGKDVKTQRFAEE